MNKEYLKIELEDAKRHLAEAIRDYVFEHGEEPTRKRIEEFGLEEGEENGCKVTRILDFFNNIGCRYLYAPYGFNTDCDDITDDNWGDTLWSNFEYVAMHCLYLVEDKDGTETLKYYCFANGGVKWDDDQSEPHHNPIEELNLIELEYIIRAIEQMK